MAIGVTRFSLGWLATHLVRAGFLVVSVSHPGTMNEAQTAQGRYRLWEASKGLLEAMNFPIDQLV